MDATIERAAPPTEVKVPATQTVAPETVSAVTLLFAPGFQGRSAPDDASTAARRPRGCDATAVKSPPR